MRCDADKEIEAFVAEDFECLLKNFYCEFF